MSPAKELAVAQPSHVCSKRWIYALLLAAVLLPAQHFLKRPTSDLAESYALCSQGEDSVYTVDANNTVTQCVVVHKEHIVDTGSLRQIRLRWRKSLHSPSKKLKVHFVPKGAMILPGISDSHAHIMEYGAVQEIPLEGTLSIPETVQRVREFVEANPTILHDKERWIYGGRWDHTLWTPPIWPSADDLDADPVLRGRKIVLTSKDCHAIWVSSAVLEPSLPLPQDVDGGVIVRDEEGKPTGCLLDNAQTLVVQPPPTEEDRERRFAIAVRDAHAFGLTSLHDAGLDPSSLAFFQRQAQKRLLPIRIYSMTFFDEKADLRKNMPVPIIGAGGGRLTARSVKIFTDGALRTGGAFLHNHYHGKPHDVGFLRLESPQVLFDVIPLLSENGWQVNVHAVGDRANCIVLDAFEASVKGADSHDLRHRLEHAQMINKADIARLGKLGVIASVQPAHVIDDMWYAEDRLGPQRIKSLYPFRSIIDSGARITLGTDFPVEDMNPLNGFYAAITRLSHEGTSPHGPNGWFPEQRLSRTEALRGMTIDPAYASFTESFLGSLEVGKRADIVVLSQNIMQVPVSEIMNTKTLLTVIDGKVGYGNI